MPTMPKSDVIVIRDPIHGTFSLSPREIRLVDQPAFQRLRNIKQLGFADQAFPGATHSRYGHSLGAQHVATKLFDRLFDVADLPADVYFRFRQTMRLAILFHDLGHAFRKFNKELGAGTAPAPLQAPTII